MRRREDMALSALEEKLRPWRDAMESSTGKALGSHRSLTTESDGNLFTLRQFPMYPGEYVPAGHKPLVSLRDELTSDLLAQNIKTAWLQVTQGEFFASPSEYYRRVDGLDESRLTDIVGAVFPTLDVHETRALVRKVLESLSSDENTPSRALARTVTAESLGLDDAPQHYTNFLQWMGRMMDTVGFKTEHALYQFCRKKFNAYDSRLMYENYLMIGKNYMNAARIDGYSHYYLILQDFIRKITAGDTRSQIGVRIDPPEMDPHTGLAVGWGYHSALTVIALMRENNARTGEMVLQGEPVGEYFDDKSWWMEYLLQPFDDAGVCVRDFDVYLAAEFFHPGGDKNRLCRAGRIAIAMALTKLMPITRIHIKKAGMLSFSKRRRWLPKPGKKGLNRTRHFYKR